MIEEIDIAIKNILIDGYVVNPTNFRLKRELRKQGINYRKFSFGGSYGTVKYTCFDFIGTKETYYFIVDEKEKFLIHLFNLFNNVNPNAGKGLKGAFSSMLRGNGLIKKDSYNSTKKRYIL